MNNKSKLTISIINILLCAAIALLTGFLMNDWGLLVRIAFFGVSAAGIIATAVTFFLDKQAILKSALILLIVAAFFLASFILVGEVWHINDYENDEDKIKAIVKMIENTGAWGIAVFLIIQILQVVILPLPAAICYIPGALIWGSLVGTLLASAGVLVGSLINYFIGKVWGKKAVEWIAGKETCEKYSAYFNKKGKVIFVLMQILPFFPDDILCMVAGLTAMNFPFFLAVMILVRPLVIAAYCYVLSGTFIPFEGWGLIVWGAIFIVCIVLAVLSFKYQDRFENWLVEKFGKKNKKEEVSSQETDINSD